jgi:hypothetical protein
MSGTLTLSVDKHLHKRYRIIFCCPTKRGAIMHLGTSVKVVYLATLSQSFANGESVNDAFTVLGPLLKTRVPQRLLQFRI